MFRVSKQIIRTIHIHFTAYELPQETCVFGFFEDSSHQVRSTVEEDRIDNFSEHTLNHMEGQFLVIATWNVLFSCMREGRMTDIVQQSTQTQDLTRTRQRILFQS